MPNRWVEDGRVGRRFSASQGIAGWALSAQEPVCIEDVNTVATVARDVAASTGYVPRSILAAPLLREDEPLGVLEVLDPHATMPSTLGVLDLLTMFAKQASIALRVVQHSRESRRILQDVSARIQQLLSVARALQAMSPPRRQAGYDLLRALETLLVT